MADARLTCTYVGTGLNDPTVVETNFRLQSSGSDRVVYLNRWRSEKVAGDTDILFHMLCRLFRLGTEKVRVTPFSLEITHSAAVSVSEIMWILRSAVVDHGYTCKTEMPVADKPVAVRWGVVGRWLARLILARSA